MTISVAALRRRPAAGTSRARHDHIVQGEQRVTDDGDAVLCTILGSCVATCLRDPLAGIGGMNHFLLPGALDGEARGAGERIGAHAMELLINEMLARGAARRRLEAKLFGGACLNATLTDVGSANAAFAREFLNREGIAIVGHCLGGRLGRRVQFWPTSGRARRSFLAASDPVLRTIPVKPVALPAVGSVELF